MKEVSLTFLEVKPREALELPKGTQLIEFDPHTKKFSVKRSDFCTYDYTCVYLLAKDPVAELTQAVFDNKNRRGEKPKR